MAPYDSSIFHLGSFCIGLFVASVRVTLLGIKTKLVEVFQETLNKSRLVRPHNRPVVIDQR